MSEEAQPAKTESAPPAKLDKKKILIIAGCILLVAGIGIPATLMVMKRAPEKSSELPADIAEQDVLPEGKLEGKGEVLEFEEGEEMIGAIVPFDTFLVNISGEKYIRVQIQVEFETLEIPSRFYTRLVPIRDGIITILTQQTVDDINGAKGKEKLKTQIRKFMNETLRREDVKRVYFTQFVIQ